VTAIYARCCEPTRYSDTGWHVGDGCSETCGWCGKCTVLRDGCGWTVEVERVSVDAQPDASRPETAGQSGASGRRPSEITHDDAARAAGCNRL